MGELYHSGAAGGAEAHGGDIYLEKCRRKRIAPEEGGGARIQQFRTETAKKVVFAKGKGGDGGKAEKRWRTSLGAEHVAVATDRLVVGKGVDSDNEGHGGGGVEFESQELTDSLNNSASSPRARDLQPEKRAARSPPCSKEGRPTVEPCAGEGDARGIPRGDAGEIGNGTDKKSHNGEGKILLQSPRMDGNEGRAEVAVASAQARPAAARPGRGKKRANKIGPQSVPRSQPTARESNRALSTSPSKGRDAEPPFFNTMLEGDKAGIPQDDVADSGRQAQRRASRSTSPSTRISTGSLTTRATTTIDNAEAGTAHSSGRTGLAARFVCHTRHLEARTQESSTDRGETLSPRLQRSRSPARPAPVILSRANATDRGEGAGRKGGGEGGVGAGAGGSNGIKSEISSATLSRTMRPQVAVPSAAEKERARRAALALRAGLNC